MSDARPLVLILDPMHPAGAERLRARFEVVEGLEGAPLDRVRGLTVRTSPLRADLIARLPALEIIAKHGAGVDNIDIPAATARGIAVANTPGDSASAEVAEGAVTLMLGVLHRVRALDAMVREGRWADRWSTWGAGLRGRTLGLVGFGRIARDVAAIARGGFGMRVVATAPNTSAHRMAEYGVEKADLPALLAESDVVSIHAPLTEATRNLIGAPELAAMKPAAILVNTARGGLVDEPALIAALREGRIAGAGLDVLAQEPPSPDNPLFAMENVLLSPHVIAFTEDGLRDLALRTAHVVETALTGERPATLLNPEAWKGR